MFYPDSFRKGFHLIRILLFHKMRGWLRRAGAVAALGLIAPRPLLAADRLKINLVNTAGNTNVVLATLLKQEGIFEELGLDASVVHVSDGSKLIGGLLSGQMDMCALSGFGQVLPAIEKGAKLKVLAGGALVPLQGILTKLGFSHSRCVSKCIFHALPDMARNFYAVSAWPRHERNLVMPDFATYSRDCIAECQDRFWIPCGGSRFEFL